MWYKNIASSVLFLIICLNSIGQCNPTPTFGSGTWNVYGYRNNDFTNIRGSYTQAGLSFDSRDLWATNRAPDDAVGYTGCNIGNNNHSVRYMRTDFTCGTYQIDVPAHDDNAFLYIDGVEVWSHLGCCDSHSNVWTGLLNPTSTIEFSWREFNGGSYGALTLTQLSSSENTPILSSYDCATASYTLTADGLTAYSWTPTTELSPNLGAIVSASPSISRTYSVTGTGTCTGASITKEIILSPVHTTLDPATDFGDGEWYVFAHSSRTFDNYQGYYIESGLTFNSTNDWTLFGSPSDHTNYIGCNVPIDNHSVQYKRRSFDCGTYQISITNHDDEAYLLIDGIEVWNHNGWGDVHNNVWEGSLTSTSTVEFRWGEGGGESNGGISILQISTPTGVSLTSTYDCALSQHTLNATGISNAIWSPSTALNTTSGVTVISSTTDVIEYIVSGQDECTGLPIQSEITIYPIHTSLTPSTDFGDGIWYAYAYNGNNFNTYEGYSTETNLSFDSRNDWGSTSTPSSSLSYIGCDIPVDQHSVSYKRQGFPCGTYQIDVNGHDDYAFLLIDGQEVWNHYGCCDTHPSAWIGYLGENSTVEFKWREFGGGSYGELNFTYLNSEDNIILSSTYDCTDNTNTLVATGGSGYTWSPSTGLNTTTGSTVIATPLTTTTYTVSAIGECTGNTQQKSITIYPSNLFTPSDFGINQWNVYAYNGNNFNTYGGFYVRDQLSFSSRDDWGGNNSPSEATGYAGCEILNDQHSYIFKRQSFPCGTYQINVTSHDDYAYLYVDGILVWSHLGCCDTHANVWSGQLDGSSTIEYRIREFGGESFAGLDFIGTSNIVSTWQGNSSDWNSVSNWDNGVPTNSIDVIIPVSATYPTITSTVQSAYITINHGAELALNSTGILSVFGNLNSKGTLNNSGEIIMAVSCGGVSSVAVPDQTILQNMTIDNPLGVEFIEGSINLTGYLSNPNGDIISNNRFTLSSSATSTGNIGPLAGSFSGTVVAERYIDAGATNWRFLSSPVNGNTLEQWKDDFLTSGFPGSHWPDWPTVSSRFVSIYHYEEDAGTTYNDGFIAPTDVSNPIELGRGYWVWSGDSLSGTDPFTISVEGPVNQGTINLPVTYTPSTGDPNQDGWNTLANPYPCTIDWESTSWIKSNINSPIYIWNPDVQQFATYIPGITPGDGTGIGILGGSRYIASGQAFAIQSIASSPQLQITEQVKTNRPDQAFIKKPKAPLQDFAMLKISITGHLHYKDETAIRFLEQGTLDFDTGLDAIKIKSQNHLASNIYTNLEGTDYAVNTIPLIDSSIQIPLNIKVGKNEVYTFDFQFFGNIDYCYLMEDTEEETIEPIIEGTPYTFEHRKSQTKRFILHIIAPPKQETVGGNCSNPYQINLTSSYETTHYIWKNEAGSIIEQITNSSHTHQFNNVPPGAHIFSSEDALGQCPNNQLTTVLASYEYSTQFELDEEYYELGDTIFPTHNINEGNFNWYLNDVLIDTNIFPKIEINTTGDYEIKLEHSIGVCSSESQQNFYLHFLSNSSQEAIGFKIINGQLILKGLLDDFVDIDLFDINGKLIHSKHNTNRFESSIDLSKINISNGVYLLRIHSHRINFTSKLIVAH